MQPEIPLDPFSGRQSRPIGAAGATSGIFDPIHGTIALTPLEFACCDSPEVGRLRFIKQLGFAEMAFPGATHSRFSHSLGALHAAGLMFDRLALQLPLPPAQARRLRQALRLALLCHDLGHAPMSHAAEQAMPAVGGLGLGGWQRGPPERQADHEDYTLAVLTGSSLTDRLAEAGRSEGVTAGLVAALVVGRAPPEVDLEPLMLAGTSLLPMLHALVSGELDADRVDYLRRDAHFTGVGYGNFDHLWLTGHLVAVRQAGGYQVALSHRAVWALENFLLARHHMFLAVYHHHTAVALDHMLGAYLAEAGTTWPAEVDRYLACDDTTLWQQLRGADSRWARGIVARKPLKNIAEAHQWSAPGEAADTGELGELSGRLAAAGIESWVIRRESLLSRYGAGRGPPAPLGICEPDGSGVRSADTYTPLYERYRQVAAVGRLYCWPKDAPRAQQLVRAARAARPR